MLALPRLAIGVDMMAHNLHHVFHGGVVNVAQDAVLGDGENDCRSGSGHQAQ